MNQILDRDLQESIMNAIVFQVERTSQAIREVVSNYDLPSVIFRPSLKVDGNQWCALYGDNLQDGVAGFGDSPANALHNFDQNWFKKLSK